MKAIDESDIVVIEYTMPNFSTSHQINYALLKKKPILVLRQKSDNPDYSGSYLDALNSPLLIVKDYSKKEYEDHIKNFIGYSEIEFGPQRYNIVLDRSQKLYLDWASVKYKKSRSEIIRELINEKVKTDKLYKLN